MKAKMGLRIIYGKSGSGKSEYCFSDYNYRTYVEFNLEGC